MTDNDYRPLFPTEPPRQTLERNRLQPPPRKGQISYDEFLTWATASGKSARPIGRFETNPLDRAPSKPPVAKITQPLDIHRNLTETELESLQRLSQSPRTEP